MEIAIPRTVLALARYGRRLSRQKADAIVFTEAGIEIRGPGKEVEQISYAEIEALDYVHFPKGLPGMVRFMSGSLLSRQEARVSITYSGERSDFTLEANLEYRQHELVLLFKALYQAGIPLTEQSPNGNSAFLLKVMPKTDVTAKIAELRGQGPDQ